MSPGDIYHQCRTPCVDLFACREKFPSTRWQENPSNYCGISLNDAEKFSASSRDSNPRPTVRALEHWEKNHTSHEKVCDFSTPPLACKGNHELPTSSTCGSLTPAL